MGQEIYILRSERAYTVLIFIIGCALCSQKGGQEINLLRRERAENLLHHGEVFPVVVKGAKTFTYREGKGLKIIFIIW
jgi:hypothetical protein